MILLWPHFYDREISLSREEKRQVNRRAWKIWFERRPNVLLYIAVLVPLNAVLNLIPWVMRQISSRNAYWHWPVALATYVILLIAAVVLLQRYRFGPPVRRAVRELGYDICLRCGYWLKGLDDTVRRCPECGDLRPRPAPTRYASRDDESRRTLNPREFEICDTCAALVPVNDATCPECDAARTSQNAEGS